MKSKICPIMSKPLYIPVDERYGTGSMSETIYINCEHENCAFWKAKKFGGKILPHTGECGLVTKEEK